MFCKNVNRLGPVLADISKRLELSLVAVLRACGFFNDYVELILQLQLGDGERSSDMQQIKVCQLCLSSVPSPALPFHNVSLVLQIQLHFLSYF